MSRCERCQADKSAVSDGLEELRSCISVMGCMPRENDHVSFGKPYPVRAALLSPQTGNGAGLCGVWTRVVTPASPVLPLQRAGRTHHTHVSQEKQPYPNLRFALAKAKA